MSASCAEELLVIVMTNAKTESAVCLLAKSVSGNTKKKGEQNQAESDDRLGEPANALNFGGALLRQLKV